MPESRPDLARRGFLRRAGLLGAGVAAGGFALGGGGYLAGRDNRPDQTGALSTPGPDPGNTVPFYGPHQAGIIDRAPAHLRFTSYDLVHTPAAQAREQLATALKQLTAAVAAMTAGRWIPAQTDVARGLGPARLTVTVGLGARAITAAGQPVPGPLAPIPDFPGERLDPARSGGDLGIQVCADDLMVVASVTAAVTSVLAGRARPRWTQTGFLPRDQNSTDPAGTPRNLLGQLDGTDNPTGARRELAVWDTGADTPWMAGGSYLVCRRIRMLFTAWQRLDTDAKQAVVGRTLDTGAPLSGGSEHSVPDFTADPGPALAIPAHAHVRLTHPANNAGATMLRRGYSYDDGLRPDGTRDAGLFFQAFQPTPGRCSCRFRPGWSPTTP